MRKAFFVFIAVLISAVLVWLSWIAASIFIEGTFVPTIANVTEKDLAALMKCLCGMSILWGAITSGTIAFFIMMCHELYEKYCEPIQKEEKL